MKARHSQASNQNALKRPVTTTIQNISEQAKSMMLGLRSPRNPDPKGLFAFAYFASNLAALEDCLHNHK